MSTITREQAKDLRNAFQCWQQDYDPVEDKEQYDMFGLGVVAMDALLASLEADGTLTNEGTIPVTQFKPVADLYGITSPTGSETSFTFDAVEARDFIDGGWSCQEYVELERFQEAVSGNSPVIPDGYVLVPEEPTHEMLEAGDDQFGTYDVYRRMIAAAPLQEVK